MKTLDFPSSFVLWLIDKPIDKGYDEESTLGEAFQRTLQKLGEAKMNLREHGFMSCAPSADDRHKSIERVGRIRLR